MRCHLSRLPRLAAVAAAAWMIPGCGGNPVPVTPCATFDSAYLSNDQLGGNFQVIVDQKFTAAPAAAHSHPVGTPPPQISQWLSGKLMGWIATIAVDGPDRPAEDALARSLGDTVGKWPLVPLSGAVVEHNPGILEVYQANDIFSSAEGAQDYFSDLSRSAADAETTTITVGTTTKPRAARLGVSGGDQSFGDQTPRWMDPTIGMTETYVSLGVRVGVTVVQLTVQGGSTVGLPEALTLVNHALARLAASCHIGTSAMVGQ